ncbi:MAG: homoserine kinase [Candidatus Dormibacteria bacterium]
MAPASSANLGCALDAAAVALDLTLEVQVETLGRSGLEFCCEGEAAKSTPQDGSNLVVRSIRRMSEHLGVELPGLRVGVRSRIPVAAGLGSSAAAVVAGLLAGARLCSHDPEEGALLQLAAELEGHPDNVAAAYLGGLVVVAAAEGRILARRAPVPAHLRFLVAIPDLTLSTADSRSLLPATLSRGDAVHNLQRGLLLVASAFAGDFNFDPELFDDRWHQRSRSALVPGMGPSLALAHPALAGAWLSGAGPSVVALTSKEGAAEVAQELRHALAQGGVSGRVVDLGADNQGAKGRLEPVGDPA